VSHSVLQAGFAMALGKAALSSEDADFLRQAGDDWRPGEAPDAPVGDLLANLAKAWRIAGDANPDHAPLVELTPGHGEAFPVDLLVVVQPDKPFLVDSVMGELADGGFAVRAMFHPVVTLHGRETSVILVMLEPVGRAHRRRQGVAGRCGACGG
jgi:glutamate dehydrogenase